MSHPPAELSIRLASEAPRARRSLLPALSPHATGCRGAGWTASIGRLALALLSAGGAAAGFSWRGEPQQGMKQRQPCASGYGSCHPRHVLRCYSNRGEHIRRRRRGDERAEGRPHGPCHAVSTILGSGSTDGGSRGSPAPRQGRGCRGTKRGTRRSGFQLVFIHKTHSAFYQHTK